MARSGGHRGAGGARRRPQKPASKTSGAHKGTTQGAKARSAGKKALTQKPAATPAPPVTGPFRLGAVEGATPGKWIDIWQERLPGVPLELVALTPTEQREALTSASVDAAIVRVPLADDDLHVIALYDEVPVVVCAADSHLTAADELSLEDLAGEVLIVSEDAVLTVDVAGTVPARFAPPATAAEAIATAATGIGVVIVPMSLARLHHRKDTAWRPLRGGPMSRVALAWPREATTPAVETFVGIVRGRSVNSSR